MTGLRSVDCRSIPKVPTLSDCQAKVLQMYILQVENELRTTAAIAPAWCTLMGLIITLISFLP